MSGFKKYLTLIILCLFLSQVVTQDCYDNTNETYATNDSSYEVNYFIEVIGQDETDNATLICFCPGDSTPN